MFCSVKEQKLLLVVCMATGGYKITIIQPSIAMSSTFQH